MTQETGDSEGEKYREEQKPIKSNFSCKLPWWESETSSPL
jgi:hypothetical protein